MENAVKKPIYPNDLEKRQEQAHTHAYQEHDDSCGCGHEHSHGSEPEHAHTHQECGCGHEHGPEQSHGHSHTETAAAMPQEKNQKNCIKRVFLLENLGCANCAAKMETRINALPEVNLATITFATKQLRVEARDPDSLIPKLQEICSSIESEVVVTARAGRRAPVPEQQPGTATVKSTSPGKKIGIFAANRRKFLELFSGAACFAAGLILSQFGLDVPSLALLIAAYLILGLEVLITAGKNILKGQVFDENFLMSIATVGAFCIREYPEAVGVMLFYRVGELFEDIAVERSRTQIMDAVDMRPEVVTKVHGSHTHIIPAEEAAVGDVIQIRPGDRIPLDGTILEGESRLDTSPVTGEPVPVSVGPGSEVISGCVNTSGLLKVRVEKILEESMVTKILDSVENAAASKPRIERFITRFARIYTPFVVALAAATAILPSLFTGDWNYWIKTALTFLVISCPCALVLSVPLAFFSGLGAGSKRGILFKGGISLEAMRNIKVLVMDKTGTITKGNFVLQEVRPSGDMDINTLLRLCASCESASTHPIAHSIVTAAQNKGLPLTAPDSVEEFAGKGILARLPEGEMLCGNRKLMEQFHISMDQAHGNGYGTEIFAALNGTYTGHLVISDTIKEEAASAIRQIKSKGITTAMLTGDAADSASAVAKATGIDEVHARLLPQEKLSELQKIREKHGEVMFVGDGINDAPVLAGADVGAAMGSGADAAIEAADVVFMTSSMSAIPQAFSISRAASRVARENVIFALIIKALVMILGLLGFANMWMAVFADTGVAMLCVLNSIRILYKH